MIRFLTVLIVVALAFAAATLAPPHLTTAVAQERAQAPFSCSRNSECDAPLVCLSGRCRYECNEDRDCGAGRHCALVTAHSGRCEIDSAGYVPPDAPYCVAPRDCTGNVCTRSQCAN